MNEGLSRTDFNVSFAPNGDWFIFHCGTNLTWFKGFSSKRAARQFLINNFEEFRRLEFM